MKRSVLLVVVLVVAWGAAAAISAASASRRDARVAGTVRVCGELPGAPLSCSAPNGWVTVAGSGQDAGLRTRVVHGKFSMRLHPGHHTLDVAVDALSRGESVVARAHKTVSVHVIFAANG